MNITTKVLIIYIIAINITAFAMMGIDKKRAARHKWRIPEKTLFLSAIMLGGAGANLGMRVFRHKTKHMKFVIGMPFILLLQLVLGIWLIIHFKNGI